MTKKEARQLSLLGAYKRTFKTVHGKEVLGDLIDKCGFFATSYVEGDQYGTAYNEGQRNMALYIVSKLELKPDDIREMYNEHKTYLDEGDYNE